jgi:hypothetical protein
MSTVALFTIEKLWKYPRCPHLMKRLIKCGIYAHWSTILPLKKNEVMLFAGKLLEL